MWKRPLNSVALATPTHRGTERVSDGTNTQVVAWISTSEGSRLSKENYIIEETLHEEGIEKLREKYYSNQEPTL